MSHLYSFSHDCLLWFFVDFTFRIKCLNQILIHLGLSQVIFLSTGQYNNVLCTCSNLTNVALKEHFWVNEIRFKLIGIIACA